MNPVWTPLHAQVHQALRDRQLLPTAHRILIALSGGQDSLCLAQLLIDLQPKWGWELAIAHADHGWRQDSAANAIAVAQQAEQWGLPCYVETATTPPRSEAAARTWRYHQLGEVAHRHQYVVICTGHTASDRAETLLYNLMRGSGMAGLQALTWRRSLASHPPIQLVRPLLAVTRTQTGDFCRDRSLAVWEDETNRDRRYARNRIRHELLPYLAEQFNPQVERTLAQTAELLQADIAYLDQATAAVWSEVVVDSSQAAPQIQRVILRSQPLALQRRVLRQWLAAQLAIAPTFDQVEKLVALITAPNRSQTDPFPGGAIAYVQDELIALRLD